MAFERNIPVRIVDPRSEKSSSGEIQVQFWDKKERTARALKFGALCWGAALVSIILPLLHFFLVPAFFIAGPIAVFILLGQENVILGGSATCPNCEAELPISRASYNLPLSELCTACQRNLKVEAALP